MNTKTSPRPGGRSARVQAAVHQAVQELDGEIDRAGLTVPLIAERAGVTPSTIYRRWGTLADVLSDVALGSMRADTAPDGTVKVLVEGAQRARINRITDTPTHFMADLTPLDSELGDDSEIEAMRRAIVQQFDQYVKLNKKIPPEILASLSGIDDAGRLADTVAAHLPLKLEQKQVILEIFNVAKRLEHLLGQLEGELDILQVEFV